MEGYYYGWWPTNSGILHGSELGLLLLEIYVNDMDKNVDGLVSLFTDDTKLGVADNEVGFQRIQHDKDQ